MPITFPGGFTAIKDKFIKILSKFHNQIGKKEIFLLGGLAMLGYGLYLFSPCISFSVCGVLLMAFGYCLEG